MGVGASSMSCLEGTVHTDRMTKRTCLNQGIESYVYVTLFARMRLHLFRLRLRVLCLVSVCAIPRRVMIKRSWLASSVVLPRCKK